VRQAPRPPILAPAKGGWTTQSGAQGLPAEPQSLAHGGDAGKPIYPIADCGLGTCTVGVAENSPAKGPARNERPKRRRQEHCGRHVCSHDAGTGQSAIRNPQSAIRNPQSAIRNPQSVIRNPQSAIRNPQSTIRNPQLSSAGLAQEADGGLEDFLAQGIGGTHGIPLNLILP
jgi:major type 1 subunit fimbrin (pilin)